MRDMQQNERGTEKLKRGKNLRSSIMCLCLDSLAAVRDPCPHRCRGRPPPHVHVTHFVPLWLKHCTCAVLVLAQLWRVELLYISKRTQQGLSSIDLSCCQQSESTSQTTHTYSTMVCYLLPTTLHGNHDGGKLTIEAGANNIKLWPR